MEKGWQNIVTERKTGQGRGKGKGKRIQALWLRKRLHNRETGKMEKNGMHSNIKQSINERKQLSEGQTTNKKLQ